MLPAELENYRTVDPKKPSSCKARKPPLRTSSACFYRYRKEKKKNASRKSVPEMNARDDGTKRKEIQSIQKRHRWRWLLQAELDSGKPQQRNTSSSSSSSQAVIKKKGVKGV
jgi:hypothetical protein